MDPHLAPDTREFILEWFEKAKNTRAPLHGSLELTRRCNLKCRHCYLPCSRSGVDAELTTDEWLDIIEQLARNGCLFLLFTGGDPLLRSDFEALYRKAKLSGVLTSVFSNGTLVTDAHCQLFRELPPQNMEITLYGATRDTYESVTQVPGSFDRCIRGIEMLLDCGVKLAMKTIVMNLNEPEYDAMLALAEGYGCSFHMDAQLFARIDGDKTPLQYRITAEDAVQHEFDTELHRRSWRRYAERSGKSLPSDKLYQCGAGVCSFHISSSGTVVR